MEKCNCNAEGCSEDFCLDLYAYELASHDDLAQEVMYIHNCLGNLSRDDKWYVISKWVEYRGSESRMFHLQDQRKRRKG